MKKNMGLVDRIVRLVLVFVVIILARAGIISGALAWILGIISFLLVVTSLIGFCPAYIPLKISTKKEKKA